MQVAMLATYKYTSVSVNEVQIAEGYYLQKQSSLFF